MFYVQFFQRGVMTGKIIEACGDRSVLILDGRQSVNTHHDIAADECRKRGYVAYQLLKGETFTRSTPDTNVIEIFGA